MSASGLHRLLARQLARAGVTDPSRPPDDPRVWRDLLARIDRAYRDHDNDRYIVERSMEVSSREMAELHARLTAERDTLTAVLAAVRSAVVELDPGGRVRYCNDAARRILGPDPCGVAFHDLVRLEDGDGAAAGLVQDALDGRPTVHQPDGAVRTPDGRTIPAAWTIAALGRGEDVQGYVITVTDLTEDKRVQRDLTEARVDAEVARRSERTRARFLANMSHELRTPLNAIIGYAELLREEGGDAAGDLDRILRAAQHLLALINDLLDLSKIDAGRMELHLEDVDVGALLAETAAAIRPQALRRGTVVEVDLAPALPPQRTDRLRLRQCLYNLASNAAKFTEGGRIVLRARTAGGWTAISVEDTGIGIPEEALGQLFQPFTQADASTTRVYGGTGLGLALTRALIELLGGSVEAMSEVGAGSTFTLLLPAGS